MSVIEPVVSATQTYDYGTSSASRGSELQSMFFTLLTTQIQYQDPLDPMENTEFTSQLAEFTSVEQMQNVNTNLGYLQLYLASINNSQSLSFIGKEVKASGNSIYWDGSSRPSIDYNLSGDAASVVVNVYDSGGTLVSNISCGTQNAGEQQVTWSGYSNDGRALPAGTYTFKVMAVDTDGNTVGSTAMMNGVVEGLTFDEGVSYVIVRGQKIPIGDIIEISGGTASTAPETEESLDLLGKQVTASGDTFYCDGESETRIYYRLDDDASQVLLKIYDGQDNLIRTIEIGSENGGDRYAVWDGTDESGTPVPEGTYTFSVAATDAAGGAVGAQTILSGTADEITYDSRGNAYVTVAGQRIPLSDVTAIQDGGSSLGSVSSLVSTLGKAALRMAPLLL